MYAKYIKPVLDFAAAATALLLLWPVLALVALAIYLSLGRPVLFRQRRAGYRGRPFTLVKFRTMREARGAEEDARRITRLGRWLRATSLDELPELANVLRGEMSLVGPRPLLVDYLDRYSNEQRRRHDVRPGITGWAQVNGRNALTWDERFRLDVWYVDHVSFRFDLHILLRTVGMVLRRDGISARGHATMPPFLGPTHDGGVE